jgi:hypothetical protein
MRIPTTKAPKTAFAIALKSMGKLLKYFFQMPIPKPTAHRTGVMIQRE